ncbi:hypothetical protein PaG_00278 [Moesziomyces aphidis]|uniref:Uncharacterized protein n=1 Tax=Moesziomyces aphidis TaxID=84754 RepID=W3VWQ9_MOEAP|nr:hypothetical protein PaG_00278 [Moesziomyces aphidis]
MQSPAPAGSAASAPPIALSPVERSAFAHLFNLADPERTGIVTGDAAVSFFAKSKLPPPVLGQIWAMADSANNGFLTPPSFSIALRLIAHAQRGEPVTDALIKRPGPPPTMEGVNLPLTAQLTGSQSAAPGATNMPGVIEIKPEDRARYTRIFANSGPSGGLIDGDRAKEIFVKSKLPFDKLGAIWNLADTQARGALDLTDFIIAMHFIQNTMNGSLNSIPAALPPGLYEQAKGSGGVGSRVVPGSPLAAQNTGGSASGFGSAMGIQRQMTGSNFQASSAFQSPQQTISPPAAAPTATAAAPAAAAPWDVTPEEKARSDQFFDGLDVSKKGRLDGAAVVPFFMQSKLTEAVLAHVWDLSDVTQTGTLSKDEFAVAMHLINAQLAGKPLPQELPTTLVPPSMRSMDLPAAVNPHQSDTQKDLFSLMDDDPPAPTISASSAFITPSPAAPVVHNQPFGVAPAPAATTAQRSAPGPFDDDFFGASDATPSAPTPFQSSQPAAATLSPAATGGSFGSAAAFRSPGIASPTGVASPSASTSRLGTAFGAGAAATAAGAVAGAAFGSGSGSGSATATDQGADFGNKSLQLQSTEKAVSDLQSRRATLESSVATNASTLAELESRLSTVRGQHDTESKLVKDLEERSQKQNAELKTLREDVIREESELSALKAEKDELEQALMRDREDVRDMKKRMNDVQTETKSLKEQLDKLRKDARQQKGLVAISKKQLATAEADQEKVAGEIEAVQRGDVEAATEHNAAPAHAEAVTSPAASVRSTNPFDRFGTGASASPQPGTPALPPAGASHHGGVGTALAAGAGAGAVLGGVAAAASHHDTDVPHTGVADEAVHDADPFGVQHTQQPAQPAQSLGFDDAFAVPGESTTDAPVQATSADFDDNFGDDFGAGTAAPTGVVADKADEPVVGDEVSRVAEPAAAGGLAADSSDDDDDGPEDVSGYKGHDTAGAAERFPDIDDSTQDVGAAAAVEPKHEERTVPGGLEDVTAASVVTPASSAPVDPSAIGSVAGERTASTTSIAPVSRQETGAPATPAEAASEVEQTPAAAAAAGGLGVAALAAGAGALTVGERGTADVQPEVSSPTDDVPLSQLMAAQNPKAAGVEPSVSPSSSIKTRRAPPPAPVRSGTALSAASPAAAPTVLAAEPTSGTAAPVKPVEASTNPFGMDDFGAGAKPHPTHGDSGSGSGFDDFDSAFEDLGPSEAVPNAAAAGTGAAGAVPQSGFDDAFDNDFDFVPSFSTGAAGAAGAGAGTATTRAVPAAPTGGQKDTFDDFDAAFDSAPTSTATAAAPAAAAAVATQTGTTSNTASGFSFDDAFDPAASTAAPAVSIPASTASTSAGAGVSSPTAAEGTYAPPPGPPPGFNAPPAVPPRSSARTATDEAEDYTGALPDDAGPVKQLCGMGFTRQAVINALEKSNYRTEKALERLLASTN